jgi:hypothetical protein
MRGPNRELNKEHPYQGKNKPEKELPNSVLENPHDFE